MPSINIPPFALSLPLQLFMGELCFEDNMEHVCSLEQKSYLFVLGFCFGLSFSVLDGVQHRYAPCCGLAGVGSGQCHGGHCYGL